MLNSENQQKPIENLQNIVARARLVAQLSLAAVVVVWFAYVLITKVM